MKIIDALVEQCKEPNGLLGAVMLKTMEMMDAGLNKWAFKQIDLTGGNILDIGCGGGKTIYALSKMFPESNIYGIDFSEEAVKMALRKNKNMVKEGRVLVQQSSVSSMQFSDDFFHCITAIRTHYFWPNLKQDVQEVFRTLKKNGKLLIFSELYKINYHMEQYNTDASISELLKDTGFETVEIHRKDQCVCIIAKK